jgi:glycosyltransferase involved in cell wall biosynthesis
MAHDPALIALFIPTLEGGGAEKVTSKLAGEFANRGNTVDLIVCNGNGPVRESVSDRVNVVDLGVNRTIAAVPALVRYIVKEKPSVVLSALTHANLAVLIAVSLVRNKPRIVIAEHNSLSAILESRGSAKRRIRGWMMSFLYPRADAIILVSRHMHDQMERLLPRTKGKGRTIYNPLDSEIIIEKASAGIPCDVSLPQGPAPIVLGVGRLTAQKDFGTLLEAFAILRKDLDVRLVILGQGPEEKPLRMKADSLGIANDVFFPGFVTNPYSVMAKSSVFVLSSLWEGLPTVVLEAMVLGIPVVCTDCPTGPREILEDGKWGQLVPPGRADEMSKAIYRAINSQYPSVPESALKRFDRKAAVDDYLDVLLHGV